MGLINFTAPYTSERNGLIIYYFPKRTQIQISQYLQKKNIKSPYILKIWGPNNKCHTLREKS